MRETRKFDIKINEHRFIGEEEYGGQIYINQVFIAGKETGLWNKRIGYALSAKRLENWEKQVAKYFKLESTSV
jgi:hypothetical protein